MEPTPERVKEYIAAGVPCTVLEVEGDGRHFYATLVSEAFVGKRSVQRHQLVYAALGARIQGNDAEIHALSLKTFTPEEWASQNT